MADFQAPIPKTEEVVDQYLVEYYRKVGEFCDGCLEEGIARQKTTPELKAMDEAIDYLAGIQWRDKLPNYRPKPVSNEVLSNFWETIGLLTDTRPIFHISEVGMPGNYSKTAKILNAMVKGWARRDKFNQTLAFWTMFGMFTTSPVVLYWNRFARGTSGDPADADISMKHLSPKALLRLGPTRPHDLEEDEMVIYRHRETLDWIKRAYPKMGKMVRPQEEMSQYGVEPQVPPTVMPQLFEQMNSGWKRIMGGSDQSSVRSKYPEAEVCEFWMNDDCLNEGGKTIWMGPGDGKSPESAPWGYWVKPGEKLYPRGRLVIRSNKITLYDEPNPYFHRKRPFVLMGLHSVPWQQYALSVLKPWMDTNDVMNQIMSGLLQAVKRALAPALMAPKSAIHPDALKAIDANKPNLKISYNSNAITGPTWQQPPNIGNYPLPVLELLRRSMKENSGTDAVNQALGKKQVPGGDTLEKIQFSKTTPIRFKAGNVETGVNEVGELWTGTALQFYDAGRRMEVLGLEGLTKEDIDDRPGSLIPEGVNSESHVRKFGFECEQGSLFGFQRSDRIQIAAGLRKNHDLSRRKFFSIAIPDWNLDYAENDAELMEEAKQMAMAMAASGVKPGEHHGGKK
jgi:hypothetical protein